MYVSFYKIEPVEARLSQPAGARSFGKSPRSSAHASWTSTRTVISLLMCVLCSYLSAYHGVHLSARFYVHAFVCALKLGSNISFLEELEKSGHAWTVKLQGLHLSS